MIGVIPKAHQTGAVEELFELFKTPWELYQPGHGYDVLITTDDAPETDAKLVLVSSATSTRMDAKLGVTPIRQQRTAVIHIGDSLIPIYGDLLTVATGQDGTACATAGQEIAGVRVETSGSTVIRLGYDLFDEVSLLLWPGQPPEHAHIPTLDLHIQNLRNWILDAGVEFVEIPPAPAGRDFVVCLTHDIDFIGIRQHLFDHSMWGFVYRATVGAVHNFIRRRLGFSRLLRSLSAAASLPFVYLGWKKDFWEPFEWYLDVEKGLPVTYFLIPFKRRPGENVPGRRASCRATAYDVTDIPGWTDLLQRLGCEIGVHGVDAWHSAEKGRAELARIAAVKTSSKTGIRVHWLLCNSQTPAELDQAGYAYDSTCGYNETVGYRAGTTQVFRPAGAVSLLELPLHVQDGALFYPRRLDLSEHEAARLCHRLIGHVTRVGGVLTLLWHDRSHGPERFWGEFYRELINRLRSFNCWFGTAGQVVDWFRRRREVRFERTDDSKGFRIRYSGPKIDPPLVLRAHAPTGNRGSHESPERAPAFVDTPWTGQEIDVLALQSAALLNVPSRCV